MCTYTPSPFPYVTAQQVHASQLRLFISLLINSSRGRSVGRVAWGPRQDEGHHQFLWPKRANRREIVQRFSHSFMESSKVNTRAYSSTYFATFDEYRVGKKDYWKKRNWVRMEFAEKVWESIERDY